MVLVPSVYITTLWLCVLLTSEEARALFTLLLSGSAFSLPPRRRGLITLCLHYYSLALAFPLPPRRRGLITPLSALLISGSAFFLPQRRRGLITPLSTLLLSGSAFSLPPRRRGLITLCQHYYSLALRSPHLRGGEEG
jgi:hypothetical protein